LELLRPLGPLLRPSLFRHFRQTARGRPLGGLVAQLALVQLRKGSTLLPARVLEFRIDAIG
jgi:hypothetical protein